MGKNQLIRGNPEAKLYYLSNNFIGGINTVDADDTMSDQEMRVLENIELDTRGVLRNRKGIKPQSLLDEVLRKTTGVGFPKKTYFIKILNDNDKLFEKHFLAARDIDELIERHSGTKLQFITVFDEVIGSQVVSGFIDYVKLEIRDNDIFVERNRQAILSRSSSKDIKTLNIGETTLFNINPNLTMLLKINDSLEPEYTFYAVASGLPENNNVYKPTPLEVRKIGFNVLANKPLEYIDSQGITAKTIQGIYLTDSKGRPVLSIPLGNIIKIKIMYTGAISNFVVKLKDGERVLKADITKNTGETTASIMTYDVILKDVSVSEVEIEITAEGDETVGTYRDYYSVAQIDENKVKDIKSLAVGDYNMIDYYSRTLYYKDNQMWFSEVAVPSYIPNYNYVFLNIGYDDTIQKITFFRNSHIIFTKKRIYKMTGGFGASNFSIQLINDYIGCNNPETVRYVGNYLLFMSDKGLYRLKTNNYSPNLENVERLDTKIKDLTTTNEEAKAVLFKDKYMLFNNNDVLKLYYDYTTFTTDKLSIIPNYIFNYNADIYILSDGMLGKYDYDGYYLDMGNKYESRIKTSSITIEYPTHDKKVKNVFLKVEHGGKIIPLLVTMLANGRVRYSPEKFKASINSKGEVEYNEVSEPTMLLQPNNMLIGNADLGDTSIGNTDYTVHKLIYPAKLKNIALDIRIKADSSFALYDIGYVYKLGKVRE